METFIAATQQASRGELTEATARNVLDNLLKASGHGALRHSSIRTFLNDWIAGKEIAKAKGTATRIMTFRHSGML